MSKKCPICGREMFLQEVLKRKLNTANVVKNYKSRINRQDLNLYKCNNCNHAAVDNYLNDEFYTDFSVALGGGIADAGVVNQRSKQFTPMIENLANLAPDAESFFEIGSGCGYVLNAALKKFNYVLGIEPSVTEYKLSQNIAAGAELINEYFGRGLGISRQYSAFAATMVFEHIPDAAEAMRYAYDLLKDEGVGYISVPNGQRTYFGGCYYDIYPQHLHYYSLLSLSKLATDAGFEILSIYESTQLDYLEMMVKKNVSYFKGKFNKRLDSDREKFRRYAEHYERISLWGASYVARSCVEFMDVSKIQHFFDVSSIKVDKYIAEFPLKIEVPTKEKVLENDLIIIFANEYTVEVLSMLDQYGYKGKIIGFDRKGFLKEF